MYTPLKRLIFAVKNKKELKEMKTMFYEESSECIRWIDVETNYDGEFDVVFKTQALAPDGGLYAEVSRDIIGYGFKSEKAAEECAEDVAAEFGF